MGDYKNVTSKCPISRRTNSKENSSLVPKTDLNKVTTKMADAIQRLNNFFSKIEQRLPNVHLPASTKSSLAASVGQKGLIKCVDQQEKDLESLTQNLEMFAGCPVRQSKFNHSKEFDASKTPRYASPRHKYSYLLDNNPNCLCYLCNYQTSPTASQIECFQTPFCDGMEQRMTKNPCSPESSLNFIACSFCNTTYRDIAPHLSGFMLARCGHVLCQPCTRKLLRKQKPCPRCHTRLYYHALLKMNI